MATTPSGLTAAEAEALSAKQQADAPTFSVPEGGMVFMDDSQNVYMVKGGKMYSLDYLDTGQFQGDGPSQRSQAKSYVENIYGPIPVLNSADVAADLAKKAGGVHPQQIMGGHLSTDNFFVENPTSVATSHPSYSVAFPDHPPGQQTAGNIDQSATPVTGEQLPPTEQGTLGTQTEGETQYTSLANVYGSRPDLQEAFPQGTQAGTADNQSLNDWWNAQGATEYPGYELVQPGDPRDTARPLVVEEQQGVPRPVDQYTSKIPGYEPPSSDPGVSIVDGGVEELDLGGDLTMAGDTLGDPTGDEVDIPDLGNSNSADSTVASTEKLVEDNIKLLEGPETETKTKIDELMTGIEEDYIPATEGKGAYQLEQEKLQGVQDKKDALNTANTKINTLVAEYRQMEIQEQNSMTQIEGRAITMASIEGAKAQSRRMYLAEKNALAAEIGIYQAQALGLQGSLTQAQDAANRAVDLKYSDAETRLQNQIMLLNAYQGQYTAEQATRATAVTMAVQEKQQQLAYQKEREKEIGLAMVDAAVAGAPQSVLDAMLKAPNLAAAVKMSAPYLHQAEAKWSEPYEMGGNMVQKNSETNEIRIASDADDQWSEPYVIGDTWIQKNKVTNQTRAVANVPSSSDGNYAPSAAEKEFAAAKRNGYTGTWMDYFGIENPVEKQTYDEYIAERQEAGTLPYQSFTPQRTAELKKEFESQPVEVLPSNYSKKDNELVDNFKADAAKYISQDCYNEEIIRILTAQYGGTGEGEINPQDIADFINDS